MWVLDTSVPAKDYPACEAHEGLLEIFNIINKENFPETITNRRMKILNTLSNYESPLIRAFRFKYSIIIYIHKPNAKSRCEAMDECHEGNDCRVMGNLLSY